MLTIAQIREELEKQGESLSKRGIHDLSLLERAVELDEKRRKLQFDHDEVLAESKKLSKEIGALYGQGKKDEAEKAKAQTADLKEKSRNLGNLQDQVEDDLRELLYQIPNIPQSEVPAGQSENDNEVVREGGEKPTLHEAAKPHWELCSQYDIIDFELGVKLAGAGFPVYKGQGARLQRALSWFFLDEAEKAGYTEYIPSLLVNEDSGYGTGQLPDKEGQMYELKEDKLFLVPTAEVPLTNIYRDSIIKEADLPIKMTGFTSCFRREAGSYGKDVRGLNRLHQFEKVEIVQIVKPEDSADTLLGMVSYVESLIQKLELPYRILRLCGGDLGFVSAITYDFEVWSAAQSRWLEVSSVSNFETYQANRLKLRYADAKNKKHIAHTLNGSALAFARIVGALLENNQTPDGIRIPEALRAYTGFDLIQ
jgi:seryl-tRNA synthetase